MQEEKPFSEKIRMFSKTLSKSLSNTLSALRSREASDSDLILKQKNKFTRWAKENIIERGKANVEFINETWTDLRIFVEQAPTKNPFKKEFEALENLPFQTISWKIMARDLYFLKVFLNYIEKTPTLKNKATPEGFAKFKNVLENHKELLRKPLRNRPFLKKDKKGNFIKDSDGYYVLDLSVSDISFHDKYNKLSERSRIGIGFDVVLNQNFMTYPANTEGITSEEYCGSNLGEKPEIAYLVELALKNNEGNIYAMEFTIIPIEYLDCFDEKTQDWIPALRPKSHYEIERNQYILYFEDNPYQEKSITERNKQIDKDNPIQVLDQFISETSSEQAKAKEEGVGQSGQSAETDYTLPDQGSGSDVLEVIARSAGDGRINPSSSKK